MHANYKVNKTASSNSHNSKTTRSIYTKFFVQWPWFGPPLRALRYVKHFRFCGWHHIFIVWGQWARYKHDVTFRYSSPGGGTSWTCLVTSDQLIRQSWNHDPVSDVTGDVTHRLCNLVMVGLPASTLSPLQRVQSAAARLILGLSQSTIPHHSCSITTPLVTSEIRIIFTVATLTHNIFHHCATRTSAISSLSATLILIVANYGRQQSDLPSQVSSYIHQIFLGSSGGQTSDWEGACPLPPPSQNRPWTWRLQNARSPFSGHRWGGGSCSGPPDSLADGEDTEWTSLSKNQTPALGLLCLWLRASLMTYQFIIQILSNLFIECDKRTHTLLKYYDKGMCSNNIQHNMTECTKRQHTTNK